MRILYRFAILLNVVLTLSILSACNKVKPSELKLGIWKAELYTKDHVVIPFVFEIKEHQGKRILEIHNAQERLLVDQIEVIGDSLKITMPFYDSEFMLVNKGDSLIGRWLKNYDSYKMEMPFKAFYNQQDRFTVKHRNINSDFVGTWNTTFLSEDKKDTSMAIAELRMVDNKIYGTFLSTTGDYRYLEGLTDSNKLFLSAFDGSHVYFFTAELSNNNMELSNGIFYSGLKSKQTWSAKYDQYAKLPDADKLTFLKEGYDEIDFKFKNLEGKEISIKDERYKNKVVLVQIMGSWCPNCVDETNYLVPFYQEKKEAGVEIIGLCYERSEDFSIAAKNAKNLQKRLNIPYELLIAGTNKKGMVNASLPMLKNFLAFPTMIVIDKKGKVRKIHTGYSGPATGNHYLEFKAEFESFINQLLSEN